MKIVVNRCYGGFGLSSIAMEMIGKRKGLCVSHYVDDMDTPYAERKYKKVVRDYTKCICIHHVKGDFGDIIDKDILNDNYFSDYDIERNDPDLIAVVEELGDLANGRCAKLKILDIPDDVEYEIDNYDGIETVHEVHRSW